MTTLNKTLTGSEIRQLATIVIERDINENDIEKECKKIATHYQKALETLRGYNEEHRNKTNPSIDVNLRR